jgi:hypothetical protein
LCRLAVGGGFATRQLYTGQDEQLFDAQRPIILNGIEDIVNRQDLADRSIFLDLDPIPENARKLERELKADFDQVRPRILGALLDVVAYGLKRLPETHLSRLPRMADFAKWATACETNKGEFMKLYDANIAAAVANVIEADPVSAAVQAMMADKNEWKGTATELLEELERIAGEKVVRNKRWPESPQALSGRIKRGATFLRRAKINIEAYRNPHTKKRGRVIAVTKVATSNGVGETSSEVSEASETAENGHLSSDDSSDANPIIVPRVRNTVRNNPLEIRRRTIRTLRTLNSLLPWRLR